MPRSNLPKHINASFRPLWVIKTLGIVIASCYSLLLIGNYLLINSQDVSYKKWQKSHPLPSVYPTNPYVVTPKPTPKITSISFSGELPKERTQFDLTNWQTFSDSRIGLKFKYPPSWGTPQVQFFDNRGTDACKTTGKSFTLTMSNSKFMAGGESPDSSTTCGRGRGIQDLFSTFSGFSSCSESKFMGANLLYCQDIGGQLHLLSGHNYWPAETFVGSYYRLLLLNQNVSQYSGGIALGGPFFSSELNQKISLMCKLGDEVCQEKYYSLIDRAVLDRKLDNQSMSNFDTFEKVFETVEIIK